MSIELERRVRQLETRLDELLRSVAAAAPRVEEVQSTAAPPPAKPRPRDAAGRYVR
jgi:hypothetical protein